MKYPAIVLRDRLDDLSYEAARSRGSWEASKVISLGGAIAAGVAATVNPVMMIAAVGSMVGYAWAVVGEGSRSRRFKPLPMTTKSLLDIFGQIGGGEGEGDELVPQLKYLSPEEQTEALLLDYQAQSVARFLSSIDEDEREQAYKQLVRFFHYHYGALVQRNPELLFKCDSELKAAFQESLLEAQDNPVDRQDSGASESKSQEQDTQEGSKNMDTQILSEPQTTRLTSMPARAVNYRGGVKSVPGEEPEFDLASYLFSDEFGQDLKSVLIMGESGAGKGNFIYGLTLALFQRHPNTEIYALNPKPDVREMQRWQGYKEVVGITSQESAEETFRWLDLLETEMVDRQTKGGSFVPCVLVLDEFNTLLDYFDAEQKVLAMKKVKRIIRQGRSSGVYIWLGAQTGNCEDIGISSPDRANFIRIAVGYKGNCDALQIAIANPKMFPGLRNNIDPSLVPSLKSKNYGIAATSVCDRVVRLPNYLALCPATPETSFVATEETPTSTHEGGDTLWVDPPTPEPQQEFDLVPTGEPDLPTAEQTISEFLKQKGIVKSSRRGVAIFKVWRWVSKRGSQPVSLRDAWERFRKERRAQITKQELEWSLKQLEELLLVEVSQ